MRPRLLHLLRLRHQRHLVQRLADAAEDLAHLLGPAEQRGLCAVNGHPRQLRLAQLRRNLLAGYHEVAEQLLDELAVACRRGWFSRVANRRVKSSNRMRLAVTRS